MTYSPQHRVARLVTRLATALAVLVVLTPISLYAVVSYFRVVGILDSSLRLQAIAVESVIRRRPEHWQLNPERLKSVLERFVLPAEYFRVVDPSGELIVAIGQPLDWPSLVRRYPIYDFGREVGRIEAELPVAETAVRGLALFASCLVVAWLIWGPLRRLPLVALAAAGADLRRRDRYQRALLDNFPFAIWLKDTEGRYLAVNRAFAESVGVHDVDAAVGKTDFDFFPPELAERFRADDRVLLATRERTSFEEELPSQGVSSWYETYKAVVLGDHADALGTVGFTRDISARKQTEAELDSYRQRLEALVDERTADLRQAHRELLDTQLAMDKVGIGIRRVDHSTYRVVYANRFAAEMLGYTVDEMVGMHIADLEPQLELDSLEMLLRRQGQAQFESRSRTRDGRLIPVETILHYTAACGEVPAQTIAFVTDISQRKLAESHLRRLSQAVEQSLAGIVIFDAQRVIQYVNPAFIAASRYPVAELLGRTPEFFRAPDVDSGIYDELWRTVGAGKVWLGELKIRRASGELFWSQVSFSPILGQSAGDGELLGYVAILDDISERKKTLMRLQESEERFRQAFVHAPFGIAVVAVDGSVRETNTALCRTLGYAADEINGCTFEQFFDDDTGRSGGQLAALLAGTSSSLTQERVGVRRDGERLALASTLSLVRDSDSRPLNVIAQIEDISERKQLQLRDLAAGILFAQELERERLSHELHDEIGQSLTALKITLRRAQQSSADPVRIASSLNDGQHMLEHLVGEVRSIAYRLRPAELDQLGLAAALRSHLDKTIRPLGQKVSLVENLGELRLPPNLELCCFRVVQEALTNALRHAQTDSLEVTLALDRVSLRVAVTDHGVGFDLDRYYSAHERRASLGLIGMRERVSANGGHFQIRSSPGEGTEVVATFALSVLSRDVQ